MSTTAYCKGCGDRLYPNLAIPTGLDREGYELACSDPCKDRVIVANSMIGTVAPPDYQVNCGRCGVRPRAEGNSLCPECRNEGLQWQGDMLLAVEGFYNDEEGTERERDEE